MIRLEQGTIRRELIGFAGIVERNVYLIRRFVWWELAWFLYTVANTLTIVFIAKGVEAGGYRLDVNREMIILLLGMGAFAVLYGVVRTVALFGLVAVMLGVHFTNPNFATATVVLAVSSVS